MNVGYKKVIVGSLALCILLGGVSYQVSNLTTTNNELKVSIEEKESQISALKNDVKDMDNKISEQEKEIKEAENKYKEVDKKYNKVLNENKKLKKENESLEKKLKSNSRTVSNGSYNITQSEIALLEKLVYCEAGVEPVNGQIAVVNVVLNRMASDKFPDTVTGVIMQKNQFSPVTNGAIYNVTPSEEVKQSVKRALNGEKAVSNDTVYFFATWVRSGHPIWNDVNITTQIGTHYFGN